MHSALQLPDIQGRPSEYRDGRDKPSIKRQLLRKATSKHRQGSPSPPNTVLSPAFLGRFWITCSILLSTPHPPPHSPAPSHRLMHLLCSNSKCLLQPLQEVAWPSSHLSLSPLQWKLLWAFSPGIQTFVLCRCSAEACCLMLSAASLLPAWHQKTSLSFSVSIFCHRWGGNCLPRRLKLSGVFHSKTCFQVCPLQRTHCLKGPDKYISNKYTCK